MVSADSVQKNHLLEQRGYDKCELIFYIVSNTLALLEYVVPRYLQWARGVA
jgi:hypothetical protein